MEVCFVDGGIHNLLNDFYAPEARKQLLGWMDRRVSSFGNIGKGNKNVGAGAEEKLKDAGTAGGGEPSEKSVRVVPFGHGYGGDPARINTSDPKSLLLVWKKKIGDII